METHSVSLDWVIAGGESGPGARPMRPAWARALRDQCADAGVPYFFKQWGDWFPGELEDDGGEAIASLDIEHDREIVNHEFSWARFTRVDGEGMFRIGKKAAGRLLDGREWNEAPS